MAAPSNPPENDDTAGGRDEDDRAMREYFRKHDRRRKRTMLRGFLQGASFGAGKKFVEEAAEELPNGWAGQFIDWLSGGL